MFSELHQKKQCCCILLPVCLIIKVCHCAGTELWFNFDWSFGSYIRRWNASNSDNSTAFADAVVQSRCHRTIIRWLHDGIARASRSRVALLRQSGSFLFPSCYLREAKKARWHRWLHEVKTKMTRFATMTTRWPYEGQNGHTNSTRLWTFARSSGIFLACQRFYHRSRSCCRSLKNSTDGHTMASDALTNGPMYIRSDPNLNIFIIVCPSGVKFGTVWRLH